MSPHSEMAFEGSNTAETAFYAANGIGSRSRGATGGEAEMTRPSWRPAAEPRLSALLAPAVDSETTYDLVCVGFGPASLAVAIAMHDALAAGARLLPGGAAPRVLFVEKQPAFAWHAGMLLPGARMQISFIKDLASLRDPRSHFTFLNYLHAHGRLVDFTNLGTFLPARVEYEDYLRWCASHFARLVRFGLEAVAVSPIAAAAAGQPVAGFTVEARDVADGRVHGFRARNVLLATGGQPSLPEGFPLEHPRVIHSSEYTRVRQMLPKANGSYRIAVVGAGQSAAEIFHNLPTLYPNSKTWLVMRPEFLRPSDDSPL